MSPFMLCWDLTGESDSKSQNEKKGGVDPTETHCGRDLWNVRGREEQDPERQGPAQISVDQL